MRKILVAMATFALLALSFVACSSTKVVTTGLRTDLENSGLELNNSSFRYYIDRDVELKASIKATTMNKAGEGVKATIEKTRSYVLITKGTAGICKEIGDGWIKVAFEPDFPEATLIFVRYQDEIYRIQNGDSLIVYDGLNFQIQSKPTYWWNRILSFFSGGSDDGRYAMLKIKYGSREKEDVKNRKAKGFD